MARNIRTPARMGPKGRSGRAAASRADYHAVCLVGFADGAVPRFMGDNLGAFPVRVVVCKKEHTAAQKYDLGQPLHRVVVLEHVVVPSEEHGRRLKAALEAVLHGEARAQQNDSLRHHWCDVRGCFEGDFGLEMWWGIILDSALRLVESRATQFEVMSSEERDRRIAKSRPGARR